MNSLAVSMYLFFPYDTLPTYIFYHLQMEDFFFIFVSKLIKLSSLRGLLNLKKIIKIISAGPRGKTSRS